MKWKILSPQETKTTAEADEMLKDAGALDAGTAAKLFLKMPEAEYKQLIAASGVHYPDFWIGDALLARGDGDDGASLPAGSRPSVSGCWHFSKKNHACIFLRRNQPNAKNAELRKNERQTPNPVGHPPARAAHRLRPNPAAAF